LLHCAAGLDRPTSGQVWLAGRDLTGLSETELTVLRCTRIGFVFQAFNLVSALTVRENILLLLRLSRARPDRRWLAEVADRVGLADRLDDRPGTLSGGEQQRVALCAALAHRPRLLLADEPAGELDAENADTVYALIAELGREQGATALVVSHDAAAADIADRLVYVRDGRVVEEGRPGLGTSLVVTEPGWVRLPDPLLDAIGSPRRLNAERRGGELVITSAGDTDPERRAVPSFDGRPARGGGDAAELRGVVRRFPSAAHPVLDGVSGTFESGALTAVVGRSGSGKTTLLHLLAGLDRPTEGEVLVLGQELGRMSRSRVALLRREHVALVTQEPGLVPHLTACENVELGLLVRAAGDDAAARAASALADVGLADRLEHRADRLSAGERQRVAIARALAARPAVLLADEPTARLDEANARAVGELLARLARESGAAVVCATHDGAVIEHADSQLVLGTRAPRPSERAAAVPGRA
jgi:ABC-type lipoprotein export system ATPase subunit